MEYRLTRGDWHLIRTALLNYDAPFMSSEKYANIERLGRILSSADPGTEGCGIIVTTSREIGA